MAADVLVCQSTPQSKPPACRQASRPSAVIAAKGKSFATATGPGCMWSATAISPPGQKVALSTKCVGTGNCRPKWLLPARQIANPTEGEYRLNVQDRFRIQRPNERQSIVPRQPARALHSVMAGSMIRHEITSKCSPIAQRVRLFIYQDANDQLATLRAGTARG